METYKNFQTNIDERGVFTATLNVPCRALNVFDDTVLMELKQIVKTIDSNDEIKFAIFRSGKPSGFLAGADIHRIYNIQDKAEAEAIIQLGQDLFQELATLKSPTLAVIHGVCLGGGLEFALACRYRVAITLSSTKIGLPEVKLGILPAWGGTQRLPKQIGASAALSMILEGKTVDAYRASQLRLVDAVLSESSLEADLIRFVDARLANEPLQIPERTWNSWFLDEMSLGRRLVFSTARKTVDREVDAYPALLAIIEAVELATYSTLVNQKGLAFERHQFADLLFTPTARNLIELFLNQERAKNQKTWINRDEEVAPRLPAKTLVVGAGTMGAGIAQALALSGFEVVLQDIEQSFVERGMSRIEDLISQATEKKVVTSEEAVAIRKRIKPRVGWENSDDIELMIEAVVERPTVKAKLFREADEKLPLHAILASNTSALPINEMAAVTGRPEKIAGLHFFNPVHKMPLVEVVKTEQTSASTIANLVSLVKKIGKTPVVVNQSPGFLVNRILFPYLDEAVRLLLEGFSVKSIDLDAKQFGMPMGPLELLDTIGIDVALDVSRTLSALGAESSPSPKEFQEMIDQGSLGKKSGHGFYEWEGNHRGKVAHSLAEQNAGAIDNWHINGEEFTEIQQRLFLAIINEAAKCLNEHVVRESWMIDLAMVLGTGFPPYRGGPMSCLNAWGTIEVTQRLNLLEQRCGRRFEVALHVAAHLAEEHGESKVKVHHDSIE